MKKIVFATDGSKAASQCVALIGNLLQTWPEAEVVAVYVTPKSAYYYDAVLPNNVIEHENQVATHIRAEVLNDQFKNFTDRVRFRHEVGHPATLICDVAEEENADVVVVGRHGRGFFDELLMGSVSAAVAARCKRPVLVN